MKKLIFIMSLFAVFSMSCASAEWVKKNYKPKKGGIVRAYPGAESKLLADEKMAEYCGGESKVEVLSESNKDIAIGSTVSKSIDDSYSISEDTIPYIYFEFECK